MLLFFMLSAALRAAGDARTPLRLGLTMTSLNIVLNIILIRGLGPIPSFGTAGSALGTSIASGAVSLYALYHMFRGDCVIQFSRSMDWRPDWSIIKSLFRFGLPTGVQGIAMNIAGVLLLRFIGSLEHSAAAQAAYSLGYTQLFSMITWTSVGLMGASATIAGQNLGAGHPERAIQGVHTASRLGLTVAALIGLMFVAFPHALLGVFGANTGDVSVIGATASAISRALRLLHHRRARLHRRPARHRRHAQPALHHARLPDRDPHRHVHADPDDPPLVATDIWLAIVLGHFTRAAAQHPALPPRQVAAHSGGGGGGEGVRTKNEERKTKN